MNLLSMFIKGGWVMYPILLCSIVALAVIIERFMTIRKSKINVPAFLIKLRGMLKKKDVSSAVAFCMETKTPAANMIRKGLKKYRYGHERVQEAIEAAGKQEVAKLEKGLSVLATVAGVAPMIGFLGTVTGMISAFMRIETLQGSASPSDLAGGIWEALLTTAFGLGVGIIALMFYNYFLGVIGKMVSDMELISNDIIDVLEDTGVGAGKTADEDIEIEL